MAESFKSAANELSGIVNFGVVDCAGIWGNIKMKILNAKNFLEI